MFYNGSRVETLYFQAKVFQKVAVTYLTYQGSGKTYLACLASYRLLNLNYS